MVPASDASPPDPVRAPDSLPLSGAGRQERHQRAGEHGTGHRIERHPQTESTTSPTAIGGLRRDRPPCRTAARRSFGPASIVGVLVVVFGIILPQFVDYEEVHRRPAGADASPQIVLMSVLGVIAWFVCGQLFTVADPGPVAAPRD